MRVIKYINGANINSLMLVILINNGVNFVYLSISSIFVPDPDAGSELSLASYQTLTWSPCFTFMISSLKVKYADWYALAIISSSNISLILPWESPTTRQLCHQLFYKTFHGIVFFSGSDRTCREEYRSADNNIKANNLS
jgi:hypothetical protein